MKKLILLSLFMLLAVMVFADAFIIGNGTSTTSTNPFYGLYNYSWCKTIYTQAEINTAGLTTASEIMGIGFYVGNTPANYVMENQLVYVRNTTQSIYESTDISYPGTDGFTHVFTGNLTYNGSGWHYITFNTPFNWNGTGNIEFLYENRDAAYVTGYPTFRYTTTSTDYRTVYKALDASFPDTVTGTRTYLRANITLVTPTTTPPTPANIVSPIDGGTLVSPFATLNWLPGTVWPTGYKISLGTNNPPTNIVNNLDIGNVLSYDPNPNLLPSTTYYWKVVPFNTFGDAPDCPVWSFTTHGDATITTLPYTQHWDSVTAPEMPFDWTAVVQSTVTTAYVRTNTTTPYSTPNNVQMANSTDANAQLLLVSPQFHQSIPMNTVRVKAWVRPVGATYTLDVGVISNPTDPATFELIQTLTFTSTVYAEFSIPLSSYAGTARHVAFKHGLGGTSRTIYIDNVTFEVIAPNDLAAVSLLGNTTPSVNSPTTYNVNVFNNGTVAQSTYTVKLYNSSNVELASVPGIAVQPGTSVNVPLSWTPTAQGPVALYGKVILTGDANPANDQTPPLNVTVQPEGLMVVTIGEGGTNARMPLDFFYKNSLNQTLYYPTEIGTFGSITALSLYNQFTTATLVDMPTKIWMGITTLDDLSAGWIPSTDMTLVFDGTMNYPAGENTITYPLQVPFTYSGGNLVIMFNRPMDTVYYSSTDYFKCQTVGTNRARNVYSDSVVYDPAAPTGGTLTGQFPKTTLFMTPLSPNPLFVINPSSKNFGNVILGTTANQNFVVANAGGGTLSVSNISISGSPFFTLVNLPTLPQSLNTGQTLNFGVVYAPTAAGNHTATISITDNRLVHTVALTGTGLDTTVYTLPYLQNFDGVTIPALPMDWSFIYQATVTTGYVKTVTTSPQSTPNCVAMYNPTDLNTIAMLIAPPLANTLSVNATRVKFWAKGATTHSLKVGVMTNPSDASTFTEIQQVTLTAAWAQYSVPLTTYTGTGRFIAFRHGSTASGQTMYVDTVELEAIGAIDLAALAVTGNTTPSVGALTNYSVVVFNNGTANQTNYTVKLYNAANVELASAPGVPVNAGEQVNVSLGFAPTTEGPMSIYGKVILTGDINNVNDQTPPLNLVVMPAGLVMVTVGDGGLWEGIPWEFYYKNSLYENIYLQSELNLYGMVTSVTFYNNFVTNLPDKPVKLWLGTTTQTNLDAGWIPSTDLTLVYDGTLTFPSGENTIIVPLATPFPYTSGNLVLMAFRPMDTSYFNTNDNFAAQTVGTNRARKLYSDSVIYDPAVPATGGTLSGTFPKTSFGFIVDGMGSLSGTVTSGGTPVENVLITINGTTLSQQTNANGQYSFPYIQQGNYTLTASKLGYETQTLPFTINEDQNTVLNVSLVASSTVSVNGLVVGSDNQSVGLSDATVNLTGVINYSGTTNAQGQFTIPNVLSGNTYNYTVSRAGYQNATGSITVGSTNYNMGTIVVNEMTLPPSVATATLNANETAVTIAWRAPGTPGGFYNVDFEIDNGGWVPSSNWTNPLGDWQWTNQYNVSNYVVGGYPTSEVPPTAAHSGTGLWGTIINAPYTNAGGFSYLTQTFNLSGSTNSILRFWSWNNSFGNFDYGQIAVNGTVVWGPQWDTAPYSWQERIVDLSAYDGLSEVTIQFQHYTTTVVNYAGWYIDDIYIGPNNATRVAQQNYNTVSPVYPKATAFEIEQQIALESSVRANPASYQHPVRTAVNSRTNIDRVPVGYRVWRLIEGQETNEASWTSLTANAITDTFYVDPGWQSFPDGHYKWAVKTIYTGGVVSVPRFTNMLRKRPNDLSALSIAGNATPTVGTPADYIVTIKNTGTSAQTAGSYTVKIMSGTTELASIPGPAIAVNQELNVSVPWTPATAGSTTIFGKVVLPADTVPDNDSSTSITVLVLPSGIWAVTVGDGSQNARVPLDMYYKCSLFQSLYYPNEMGNFLGMITGIQFTNNFVTTTLQNMPTKVYLGTTTLNDLSTDWIPATNMTLVFDGTVNYPAGENLITIPFNQPYMYLNGENLIMTVLRPMDTAYYNTADNFKAQTVGTNRARKAYSDTIVYDPMAPPAPTTSQLSGQFPKTTFLVIPGGVGHLAGTVTTTGSQPLEGVSVTITGTSYQTTTNASGQYQIQNILPDNYTVNFSKYGYVTHTQQIVIVEDETTTTNVTMNPMATVNVTGTILASDTGIGLAGATINLVGYANYNANTTGAGTFTIPAVYANQSYTYSIVCPGYTSTSGTINVGATNYAMGSITLNEIAYAPHSVTAAQNGTYTAIDLNWMPPDPTAVEITESFEDTTFPPNEWTQTITNTGPINATGVYPTWCRFGSITISGNTVAPTAGSNQAGVWWDYSHQDEWLKTPSFNCPPDGYIKFDSYVFLGSTNNDHYYVKVSTDDGNTWTPLWDASAQVGGWNYYATPITVSLSAYSGLQIKLALHAVDPPSNDGLWYVWFIDNIYIGNAITAVTFADGRANLETGNINSRMDHQSRNLAGNDYISRNRAMGSLRNELVIPAQTPSTKQDRLLTGYKVWRLAAGQETNEASWVSITPDVITTTTMSDNAWTGLPNGTYRWGVKAIYTAGVASAASFSNPVVKENVTGTIVGFVRRMNNQAIAGATVSAGGYSATTNTGGAYSLILPVGSYTVTASAPGFNTRIYEGIVVAPNQNTTLNINLSTVSNEDEISQVTATALKANIPNPFNPETTIMYDILEPSSVLLEIYNLRGQKVRTLVNEFKNTGKHSIVWNSRDDKGSSLPSGIYYYRMSAGTYTSTRKMVLME